jgi:transcription-repair coupling factor (superfamily II helicase)
VDDLFETVRLRWLAEELGFEKLLIKNGVMKCYFLPSEREKYFKSDTFGKILSFIQKHGKNCKIKESKNRLILIINEVNTIEKAKKWLLGMKNS